MLLMAAWTKIDWSLMISTRTSLGSVARTCSSRSLTASATSTVLVPDCLNTASCTAGLPLRRTAVVGSSLESSARPMSRTLTLVPPRFATAMSLKSAGSVILPEVRIVKSRVPARRLPPGISMFWLRTAAITSVTVRL